MACTRALICTVGNDFRVFSCKKPLNLVETANVMCCSSNKLTQFRRLLPKLNSCNILIRTYCERNKSSENVLNSCKSTASNLNSKVSKNGCKS